MQSHSAPKSSSPSSSRHDAETHDPAMPRVILGMSVSHDTGAVILRDGEMVAAINEERLTRVKQAVGAPLESVPAILDYAGIPASEVDAVALTGRIALGDMPVNSDWTFEDGSISSAQRVAEALDAFPGGPAIMRSRLAVGGVSRPDAICSAAAPCGSPRTASPAGRHAPMSQGGCNASIIMTRTSPRRTTPAGSPTAWSFPMTLSATGCAARSRLAGPAG